MKLTKQVWKFPLHPVEETTKVIMPPDATFVAAAWQHSTPTLWFEVPMPAPESKLWVDRVFHIAGTGHPVPMTYKHLGTLFTANNNIVWHIYEVK